MNKEELKKYTCINLRCVTQSSKDGVPLNQLQNDYRQLLGVPIPFADLGYSSLENFLRDIPDFICLRKKTDGSLIVEGVADASTAHIAKLISKQKSSKKSKSCSSKPAVVTRTWGGCAKKNPSKQLKSSLKVSNCLPPSSVNRNNEKLFHPTPSQEELKKSVLINLRSVVQSCKDGVPLNRLQNDYRKFIGSSIPFENLGYSTLYEFIKSIPDVIELQKNVNEQVIAKGVVDATTAHLFGDSLKPMGVKSSMTGSSKPFVKNTATLQISTEKKIDHSSFFKFSETGTELSDLNSVLMHSAAKKKVRKKTTLVDSLSKGLSKNEEKHTSREKLMKSEALKTAKSTINHIENFTTDVSLSKTNVISPQNQNKAAKSSNQNLPIDSSFQATINGSTTDQLTFNSPNLSEKRVNCTISSKCSDQGELAKSSKSSSVNTEEAKPNLDTQYSEKAKEVQKQITTASINQLVWMHFLLYGPSTEESLRKNILSFTGFQFTSDSKTWRGKLNLISQLSKKVLQQCLFLLCIEYSSKDSKKSLRDKLIGALAAYTKKSGTNGQEIKQEDVKKELYASNSTLSSVSSDVLSKCSSYCDTSDKNEDALNIKFKKASNSDYVDKQDLLRGRPCNLLEAKESVRVQQSINKANQLVQKPATSEKVETVLEKQHALNKKVEQKVNVKECSETENSSIVSSKNTKRKRRRKRKKAEIVEKNIGSSVTKSVNSPAKFWNQIQKLKKEQQKLKLLLSSASEVKIPP